MRGQLRRLFRRIRRHWSNTRITLRGDSHYGRPEAMEWCEANGVDYVFGLPGNAVLDKRFAARLQASEKEVDTRFIMTSLSGREAVHLYECVYCALGEAENLIKLHKVQLASNRINCRSPLTNQVRLVFHAAAFWLIRELRLRVPAANKLRRAKLTI